MTPEERLKATNQLLRQILKAGSVVNPLHANAMREAVTANEAALPKRPKKRRERAATAF